MPTVEQPKADSEVAHDAFEASDLFKAVYSYAKQYMSRYDCSHDFSHVLRVLNLARYIMTQEAKTSRTFDGRVVVLAALLHDVGDRKYVLPGETSRGMISDLLNKHECPSQLIEKVVVIVENVSYSHEIKQAAAVQTALSTHPELAIVQDADRLDAIGATGIGRCFAYGAAKQPDRGLDGSVEHFVEKLEKLEGMMKTNTGRGLARQRTARVQQFREWWQDEQILGEELS